MALTCIANPLSAAKQFEWGVLCRLHHALEAAKLSPSDGSLKEYLLFFNCVPDKPMDDAMAKSVTEDLAKLGSSQDSVNE